MSEGERQRFWQLLTDDEAIPYRQRFFLKDYAKVVDDLSELRQLVAEVVKNREPMKELWLKVHHRPRAERDAEIRRLYHLEKLPPRKILNKFKSDHPEWLPLTMDAIRKVIHRKKK